MSNISSEQASKDPHLKPSKLLTTVGLIFPTYLQETTEIARKLARQQGNQAGSGQLPTKIDTRGISRESLEEMGIHPENSLLALYADLLSLALLALPIMLKIIWEHNGDKTNATWLIVAAIAMINHLIVTPKLFARYLSDNES